MHDISTFINEHKNLCKQILSITNLEECTLSREQLSRIHFELYGVPPKDTYTRKIICENIKTILNKYIKVNGGL